MPPRGHSSSSHSSSSFRSSGSSFRSSGSSSFRGPSSHSSSSYSSRPSSFGSKSSSFKGPSQHSSSSYTSSPAKPSPKDYAWRQRVNQPTGFVTATHQRPIYYYGRRHSYAYYPLAWVDADTGVSYQKGYYDENGQHYDNVTFEENGRYKNVVCHCPYCEQDAVLDLSAGEVADRSLKCPNCGGNMEIRSELDTVLSESSAQQEQSESTGKATAKKKSRGSFWIILAMLVMVMSVSRMIRRHREQQVLPSNNDIQQISVLQGIGNSVASNQNVTVGAPVYLEKQSDGSYHVVTDVVRANKILYFDQDSDSYYDEDSDCWLWLNTDMSPAVWQYWYEGISSDYGDYGWMEHDDTGWFIEKSANNWVPLPDKYDTGDLWYID